MLFGLVLPSSEHAAGGNFNLQYLSPTARKSITPFRSETISSPGHFAIRDDFVYSLYVPMAGFLWNDLAIWKQNKSPTKPVTSDDVGAVHEQAHRVFFQDKFGERHPWAFDPVVTPNSARPATELVSGSSVRIRSPISEEYLCLLRGSRVLSELHRADLSENEIPEPLDRIRVG